MRPLQKLCSFLLCNVGNRVSPSRLKEALRVKSSTTVVEYFNHLENAYLVQRLEAYSESVKARLLAPKKIYVADTALSGVMKTSRAEDAGHYLENIVYWHIRRLDENRRREFDGLQSALRRFGLKSGTIVTFDQTDFAVENGCEINIVSVADYLCRRD